MLLLWSSSSCLLSLEVSESSDSEDIVIDCAFRFLGLDIEGVFFDAAVFAFEVAFGAEFVAVEDVLREVVLDAVLFVVVELLVPSD